MKRINYFLIASSMLLFACLIMFNIVDAMAASSTKVNLEAPSGNVNEDNELFVKGWVLSSEKKNLKVLIDGVTQEEKLNLESRPDVVAAWPNFDTKLNETPGFNATYNISNLDYKKHTVEVQVLNENNNIIASDKVIFNKREPETKIWIDYPSTDKVTDRVFVKGWVMSEEKEKTIKVSIVGKDKTKEGDIKYIERPDVIKAISGYGTIAENPKPGFETTIDISDWNNGNYELKVEVFDGNDNVIKTEKLTITKKSPDTKIWLDSPSSNEITDNLFVKGWVMSDEKDTNVKVSIVGKNKTKEGEIIRTVRSDVIKAISGYGTIVENPKPGFETTMDISDWNSGDYELKVEVFDVNNKVIKTEKFTVKKRPPKTKIWLDSPSRNSKLVGEVFVKGWAMSDEKNTNVKVSILDQKGTVVKEETPKRTVRSDVIKAISGYGTIVENPKPGFETTMDISDLDYGKKYTVLVQVIGKSGVIKEEKETIERRKPKVLINVDEPTTTGQVSKDVRVKGWVMSEDKNIQVHLLDKEGKEIGILPRDQVRADVLKLIKGFGTEKENPKPGFKKDFDLSKYNIKDGKVTLTLDIRDSNNISITKQNFSFKLKKYNTTINVVKPIVKSVVEENLNVSGNVVTNAPNVKVEASFDGQSIGNSNGLNFNFNTSVKNVKDGERTLRIYVKSNDEIIETKEVTVIVKKNYNGEIDLDDLDHDEDPNKNIPYRKQTILRNDGLITLKGWAITSDPESSQKLRFYLDNREYGEVERYKRVDVDAARSNTASYNQEAGFKIYLKNVNNGEHTFSIRIYNHLNEEVRREEFKVTVYNNVKFGVDVSEHNGDINWKRVKESGIDFAMIRMGYRGYGSSGVFQEDFNYRKNIRKARENGFELGVYFFSQAKNYLEGYNEALYVNNLLNLQEIGALHYMPVLDVEYSTCIDAYGNHCGRADYISANDRIDAVRGFIKGCHDVGRRAMIYSFANWFSGGSGVNLNNSNPDEVWVAQWPDVNQENGEFVKTSSSYNGVHKMWQYTSRGHVDGVYSEYVDKNIRYE